MIPAAIDCYLFICLPSCLHVCSSLHLLILQARYTQSSTYSSQLNLIPIPPSHTNPTTHNNNHARPRIPRTPRQRQRQRTQSQTHPLNRHPLARHLHRREIRIQAHPTRARQTHGDSDGEGNSPWEQLDLDIGISLTRPHALPISRTSSSPPTLQPPIHALAPILDPPSRSAESLLCVPLPIALESLSCHLSLVPTPLPQPRSHFPRASPLPEHLRLQPRPPTIEVFRLLVPITIESLGDRLQRPPPFFLHSGSHRSQLYAKITVSCSAVSGHLRFEPGAATAEGEISG
jgi:hypothetical protein